MASSLINGKAYSWSEIVFSILDVPVAGVTAITYTGEQEKNNNMGSGDEPVSRGRGSKNYTGSIDLSMNTVEALRDVATNGDLLDLPMFNIVVSFLNTQGVQRHVLQNVEFVDDGVEASQGDTDINRSFGLIIGKIK